MSPKLSICIPAYNREKFLAQLLDSITSEAPADGTVEVCISDNASSDNTHMMVAAVQQDFPYVSYWRNSENLGPDRNFLKAVEISKGEYCWLMGSDDVVLPGAIDCILDFIHAQGDMTGVSLNLKAFNFDLSAESPTRPAFAVLADTQILFTDITSVYKHVGAYMGYLSGNIINRQIWNEVVNTHSLVEWFNGYIHVYVIGRMLQRRPVWGFVHRQCVGWRRGNDSFVSDGLLNRARIDLFGYEAIARGLFGAQSFIYKMFLNDIISGQLRAYLLAIKMNEPRSTPALLADCVKVYGRFPFFWLKLFPLFFVPGFVFKAARPIYQACFK